MESKLAELRASAQAMSSGLGGTIPNQSTVTQDVRYASYQYVRLLTDSRLLQARWRLMYRAPLSVCSPETFVDPVTQIWFKQKIATEISPEDVLRWAEEVT